MNTSWHGNAFRITVRFRIPPIHKRTASLGFMFSFKFSLINLFNKKSQVWMIWVAVTLTWGYVYEEWDMYTCIYTYTYTYTCTCTCTCTCACACVCLYIWPLVAPYVTRSPATVTIMGSISTSWNDRNCESIRRGLYFISESWGGCDEYFYW